jgi:hypothetical protein
MLGRGQMATPMTCTFSAARVSAISSMCGMAFLHGPHQVAQKSRM